MMQESWTFNLPEDFDIKEDNSLSEFLDSQSKDLGIFLSYYYRKQGAVAENAFLDSDLNINSDDSGSFNLKFDLVHFNACLAIHDEQEEKMPISFEFDSQTNELKLTGPYWPEQEMDEL